MSNPSGVLRVTAIALLESPAADSDVGAGVLVVAGALLEAGEPEALVTGAGVLWVRGGALGAETVTLFEDASWIAMAGITAVKVVGKSVVEADFTGSVSACRPPYVR